MTHSVVRSSSQRQLGSWRRSFPTRAGWGATTSSMSVTATPSIRDATGPPEHERTRKPGTRHRGTGGEGEAVMGMVSLVTDSLPGTPCKCEHTVAATPAPPTRIHGGRPGS